MNIETPNPSKGTVEKDYEEDVGVKKDTRVKKSAPKDVIKKTRKSALDQKDRNSMDIRSLRALENLGGGNIEFDADSLIEFFDMVDELTGGDLCLLKDANGLTWSQLSQILGVQERTVYNYSKNEEKEVPTSVSRFLCCLSRIHQLEEFFFVEFGFLPPWDPSWRFVEKAREIKENFEGVNEEVNERASGASKGISGASKGISGASKGISETSKGISGASKGVRKKPKKKGTKKAGPDNGGEVDEQAFFAGLD